MAWFEVDEPDCCAGAAVGMRAVRTAMTIVEAQNERSVIDRQLCTRFALNWPLLPGVMPSTYRLSRRKGLEAELVAP
jgi:hypothetical protein